MKILIVGGNGTIGKRFPHILKPPMRVASLEEPRGMYSWILQIVKELRKCLHKLAQLTLLFALLVKLNGIHFKTYPRKIITLGFAAS